MLVPYKTFGRWGYVSCILCVCVFRVEKYRPTKLDDLISHEDIIATSMYYKLYSLHFPHEQRKIVRWCSVISLCIGGCGDSKQGKRTKEVA